jgi:hypothetical protein
VEPETPIVPDDCQLQTLYTDTVELCWQDKLRQFLLQVASAARRRGSRLRKMLHATCEIEQGGCADPAIALDAGQLVQVLSWPEIRNTLDEDGNCDGLEFMEGMKKYCGRRLRIRKRVRMLFDERSRRMLRVKRPRYLLEDAICDGQGMYSREGCDRCCYFFWTSRWLRSCPGE